jgi:hypothetical protein
MGKYKMIMINNKAIMRNQEPRNEQPIIAKRRGLPKYTPISQPIAVPSPTTRPGKWKFVPRLTPIDVADCDLVNCDGNGFPFWDVELERNQLELHIKRDLQSKKYSSMGIATQCSTLHSSIPSPII